MRCISLILLAACAREPAPRPPPDAAAPPAPAVAIVEPEWCGTRGWRECHAGVRPASAGPSIQLRLGSSVQQGIANGKTISNPLPECDVFAIGAGSVARADVLGGEATLALRPGRYRLRFDDCFGCRLDVDHHDLEVVAAPGHPVLVEAGCFTHAK